MKKDGRDVVCDYCGFVQTIDKENIPESECGEVDSVLLEKIEKNNDN
ncbi:MAG: hypothetical protein J6O73_04855 [Lachnospiraceae bacterium]|nr:hypothetical protein [Lachnospiraceae bacterium]